MIKEIYILFRKLLKRSIEFRKISYSQCGEDIIVDYIFKAIGINKPSYIDIGAHDPHYLNNTYIFSKKGCKGINIEPDPYLYMILLI